ncbi:MAG: hypothetical protein M1309_07660 [Actinobacteria bacterium]|nr:hypothetical protein [Actinomycetota bacterium]
MAAAISSSVMVVKSCFLGKYWRMSPLVFSFDPRAGGNLHENEKLGGKA